MSRRSHFRKLFSENREKFRGGLAILIIAGMGIYLLTVSHAATPTASLEAESGTLAGGAASQSDTSASGGKYVQFGTAASQAWDCTSAVPSGSNYIASCPLAMTYGRQLVARLRPSKLKQTMPGIGRLPQIYHLALAMA